MSVFQIADFMDKLMIDELGYERYGIRASDLGTGVAQHVALTHPKKMLDLHLSGASPYMGKTPTDLSENEVRFMEATQKWGEEEGAYAFVYPNDLQTLAYGLNDSPAGLAAWIVEKFRRWSDCDGDVERRFTKDDLLTNLTIYWATETINSSIRLYYRSCRQKAHDFNRGMNGDRTLSATFPIAVCMISEL